MPFEAFELFDWIGDTLAGWRYLLSRSFRQRTHARWKTEGWATAIIEILFGGFGVLVTLLLLGLLVLLLRG